MHDKKVIVQILRAPIGGIRKHVFDILEYFSDKNVELVFITNIDDSDAKIPAYSNLKTFNITIKDKPELNDLFNLIKIYKILKTFNVDVIHGHGAKGGIYARVLAFLLGAKCIYTPHGGSLHRVYGKVKNKIYDLVELFFVPFTNIYLFESHYTHNEFVNNVTDPKTKSVVNYNGVDIPTFRAQKIYKAGNKLHLASFGLLRELKGHDIAIRTCAMLVKANIPFFYIIYGSGEEHDSLVDLIAELQLQEHVKIVDYSGNVLEEMLKYDFIWHPSRFESFGYVPAEAMTVGVPVIVSSVGGLKEVVDESCGYISKENTPEEYFEILRLLFAGDSELSGKIERGLGKVSEKFSKQAMLKGIEGRY
jgi:glycosyltransferase involved in cell wall biosynthesis